MWSQVCSKIFMLVYKKNFKKKYKQVKRHKFFKKIAHFFQKQFYGHIRPFSHNPVTYFQTFFPKLFSLVVYLKLRTV